MILNADDRTGKEQGNLGARELEQKAMKQIPHPPKPLLFGLWPQDAQHIKGFVISIAYHRMLHYATKWTSESGEEFLPKG